MQTQLQELSYSSGVAFIEKSAHTSLKNYLNKIPSTWKAPGDYLKKGSRSTVTKVQIGQDYFVAKIYKKMPFHRRLRYAVTQSRAFQSWNCGWIMHEANLPVARPIGILEERHFFIPGKAALLMETAQGSDLLSLVQNESLSNDELHQVSQKLESVFNAMAAAKITHGDMKATNILVDDALDIKLIDIDGAVKHRSARSYTKAREKDARRFHANWKDYPKVSEIFSKVFQ